MTIEILTQITIILLGLGFFMTSLFLAAIREKYDFVEFLFSLIWPITALTLLLFSLYNMNKIQNKKKD